MPAIKNKLFKILFLTLAFSLFSFLYAETIPNSGYFADNQSGDQDDFCIWIHPDPEKSLVITSDKGARKIFVYDLDGNTLQVISMSAKPRNIDVRYNFSLSGKKVDIVGFGQDDTKIYFYTVDIANRQLVPAGSFDSNMSSLYGFALYNNKSTNKFYAFASTNNGSGQLRQWELTDNGDGTIGGILKRTWNNGGGGLTEGLVADDETGKFYAASEDHAIYKFDAEPTDPTPTGTAIANVGENGLTADIEGIAIYYAANGEGYIFASSQGNSTFKVYDRKEPHTFIKSFTVSSVSGTDGVDVTNVSMGTKFQKGALIVHDGKRIYGVKYEDLGLSIDTDYWNPRSEDDPNLDLTAPASVTGFGVTADQPDGSLVTSAWSATSSGDDSTSGTITSFEIRWAAKSDGAIDSDEKWQAATVAFQGYANDFALGSVQIDMSSFASGDKYFAIRTKDEAGNISALESGSYSALIVFADVIAPASVTGFGVTADQPDGSLVTSIWSATSSGDDGTLGTITSFEIRWAAKTDGVINSDEKWLAATVAHQGDLTGFSAGSVQIDMSSFANGDKYFAIRTKDEAGNISALESGSYSALIVFSDVIAPASVTGFDVTADQPDGSLVTSAWSATSSGDDGTTGTITSFEIRWAAKSDGAIDSDEKWQAATVAHQGDSTGFSTGSVQIDMGSFANGDKYFAIRTKDEAGNISPLEAGSFTDIVSGLEEKNLLTGFGLKQNYPNPFNPSTQIAYTLKSKSNVLLTIYDISGREIRTLVNQNQNAGEYSVRFDANELASGIYIYKIKAGTLTQSRKMILSR